MALAIIFEDDSVAYLDAVTNYNKSRTSRASQHPVDKSALITDHVTKETPSFSVRAVISSADFNTTYTRPAELVEGGEDNPPISPEQNAPVSGAIISSPSTLLDYLPGSIGQILGNTITSDVSVDPFRGFTHERIRDRFQRAWDNSEILTILDIDFDISFGRYVSTRIIENVVMERFEDNEQVDTGDALTANFTFRQVRFATIKEVDVDISGTAGGQATSGEVSDQQAGKENHGDQSSDDVTVETPDRLSTDIDRVIFGDDDTPSVIERVRSGYELWRASQ